ncbi:MAG: hypothetical protein K8S18_17915 [Desulfobacula sp.]|nr:hypothetical protein [Desulfobacula sp.]
MTFERSYGKIKKQNNVLGFNMVNPKRKEFFIYAKYLKGLYKHHGKFYVVKKRDREYKKDRGYHQGEVVGRLFENDKEIEHENPVTTIWLYFGPGEQSLKLNDDETDILNWVEKHSYSFPKEEFEHFVKTIIYMRKQHDDYDYLKMGAGVLLNRNSDLL